MTLPSTTFGTFSKIPLLQRLSMWRNPHIASIVPSSQAVCRAIVRHIPDDRPLTIVELGAGEGRLTDFLLDNLHSNGKIVAFEINKTLVEALQDSISDPRLEIINDDALSLGQRFEQGKVDVVVSGLPMTLFAREQVSELVCSAFSVLKADGLLIHYQSWLPPFYMAHNLRKDLRRCFEEKTVEDVYLNIPPIRVIVSKPRFGLPPDARIEQPRSRKR